MILKHDCDSKTWFIFCHCYRIAVCNSVITALENMYIYTYTSFIHLSHILSTYIDNGCIKTCKTMQGCYRRPPDHILFENPRYILHRQIAWASIQYKESSYQYRKSHCGDKTILRPSPQLDFLYQWDIFILDQDPGFRAHIEASNTSSVAHNDSWFKWAEFSLLYLVNITLVRM